MLPARTSLVAAHDSLVAMPSADGFATYTSAREPTLESRLHPDTVLEKIAERLGVVCRLLRNSLEEFNQNVEARPTGVHLNANYDPAQ